MFDWKFLMLFIGLSIFNVVFSTIRSILTINGGKTLASVVSGAYYAFYNIMLIYTVADFPMWQKCLITFVCNVVGVFVVKWGEEKSRKDKLWKVEATIDFDIDENVKRDLVDYGIPFNYIELGTRWTVFNIYCTTKEQSEKAKRILNNYNAKYFVSESKSL